MPQVETMPAWHRAKKRAVTINVADFDPKVYDREPPKLHDEKGGKEKDEAKGSKEKGAT